MCTVVVWSVCSGHTKNSVYIEAIWRENGREKRRKKTRVKKYFRPNFVQEEGKGNGEKTDDGNGEETRACVWNTNYPSSTNFPFFYHVSRCIHFLTVGASAHGTGFFSLPGTRD